MKLNWIKKLYLLNRINRKIKIQEKKLDYLILPSVMYWNNAIRDIMKLMNAHPIYNMNWIKEKLKTDKVHIGISNLNLLKLFYDNKDIIINEVLKYEKVTQNDILMSIIYHEDKTSKIDLMKSPHYLDYKFLSDGNLLINYQDGNIVYPRKYDINQIDLVYKKDIEVSKYTHINANYDFSNILSFYTQYTSIDAVRTRLNHMLEKLQ